MSKYEALKRDELVKRLGAQCSPDPSREGYLIGPDVNGRICHVASYYSFADAVRDAKRMNAAQGETA